jgi:hypothetical protein
MTIQCLFRDSQAARDSQSWGNSVFQRVFGGLSLSPPRLRPSHHDPNLRRRITYHASKSAKYLGAAAPNSCPFHNSFAAFGARRLMIRNKLSN